MARVAFLTERMRLGFGVDLVVDRIASGLSERGHDVTVFTTFEDGTYGDAPYRLERLAVPSHWLSPIADLHALRFARAAQITTWPQDVWCLATPPFLSLAPLFGNRCFAIDYGVSSWRGMPARQRVSFQCARWLQHRVYLPRAGAIVSGSRFLEETLPPQVADKARVIHAGVDHYRTADSGERRAVRRSLGVDDDEVLALYVGRLNPRAQPYKGTAELLALYTDVRLRCPALRLLMAGFGEESDAEWVRSYGALALANAPVEKMPALFAAADLYVSATTWEGFDLPLAEAQRSGLPAVAYAAGAHEEVVDDGRSAILVRSRDEFEDAFTRLVQDRELRLSMSNAAPISAARFQWKAAVDEYDDVVRTIAAST